MPSPLDNVAAADYARMPEVMQTVTRRIGGDPEQTEPVEAVVEIDTQGGGLTSNNNGQMTEVAGRLEIPADQANSGSDQWVIDGVVYKQNGVSTSKDGGSQTIELTHRRNRIAAEPKTRNR